MKVKFSVFLSFIIDSILFPIQSLITRLNSQRLPVTQYRLNSKVIVPVVINYYTLSSDASLGCLWFKVITVVLLTCLRTLATEVAQILNQNN